MIKDASGTLCLNQPGEFLSIKIGNTIVDVKRGYGVSKEPTASVEIYPYDSSKESHVLVYDDKTIILSK